GSVRGLGHQGRTRPAVGRRPARRGLRRFRRLVRERGGSIGRLAVLWVRAVAGTLASPTWKSGGEMSEARTMPAAAAVEASHAGPVVSAKDLTRRYGEGETAVDA